MIRELLTNKTATEKANIKATEIAKLNHVGTFPRGNLEIEIVFLTKIDKGVEVLAKAWKDGKQLGFGRDGSVEIERFRIFNPPILVDDPLGDIERVFVDSEGVTHTRKLREDSVEAIKQSLAHTIKLVGKLGGQIVKGKIGNTTSTFYPTIDGRLSGNATTWAGIHDAATPNFGTNTTETESPFAFSAKVSASDWYVYRTIYNINTAALPDTDTIDSAVFSAYGSAIEAADDADSSSAVLVGASPASDTALVDGDYDSLGTTSFGSIAISAWSRVAYNDFTLNASGLAYISKTGYTNFGGRTELDRANTEPTGRNIADCFFMDETGTTKDPKLVVEHTTPAAGPANLKSYNTNAIANIKTMNTNAIANVKSMNTNV